MASDIDEDSATAYALDISGDGEDRDAEGDKFGLHTNVNKTEYSVDDDTITGEGNVERGYYNNFLKLTYCGSMERIFKKAVGNSMSFEGVKIPRTQDDYVTSVVNTIKGEPAFKSMKHPGQWYWYFQSPNFNSKGGKKYVHHMLPTGARPLPAIEDGETEM